MRHGYGAAIPGTSAAVVVPAAGGLAVVVAVNHILRREVWIHGPPSNGSLLARPSWKGSWREKPDYQDELADKEEDANGEDDDFSPIGVDRLLIGRSCCPGRGRYGLGGLSHDIGPRAAGTELLFQSWYQHKGLLEVLGGVEFWRVL